jgi:hypothetical protein
MKRTNKDDLNFVENLIKSSLLLLRDKDMDLFHAQNNSNLNVQKLHEVCINHRFSGYLENCLKENMIDYYVDIEYNKNNYLPKRLYIDGNKKDIRPDIIVHTRNNKNKLHKNYLIIEAKKDEDSTEDEQKIKVFMAEKDYLYKYGCKIIYGNLQDNYNIKIYFSLDGKEISEKNIVL